MLDLLRDAEVPHLRVREDLVDAVDRATGDAGAVQDLDPLGAGAAAQVLLDRGVELVAMLDASVLGAVARVLDQRRGLERATQAAVELVGAGDVDVPVLRAEEP